MVKNWVFHYLWNYGVNWIPTMLGVYLRRVVLGMFADIGPALKTSVNIIISNPKNLKIGSNVWIGRNCVLSANDKITIGNDTMIALDTLVLTGGHSFGDRFKLIREQGHTKAPITIGKDVWVGARCTILQGSTIGDGAVVGACSLVRKEVPEYAVVAGVPAKVVRMRE